MSDKVLKYKGFIGSAEVDTEDDTLRGKLLHINGLVTYIANTPAGLKAEFEAAVDDYLKFCDEEGVEPEKPYQGSFNVRVGKDLHKKAAKAASEEGVSLNEFVVACIRDKFSHDVARSKMQHSISTKIAKMELEGKTKDFSETYNFGSTTDGYKFQSPETH